jgi:hypothetical protein
VTAASSAGLDPRLRTLFPDRRADELVGADGVHEFPLLLLSFSDRPPAVEPSGPATRGVLPEIEFPLVTAAQHSGDRDVLGDPWPLGAPLPNVPDSEPLEQVVLRRGSQHRMMRSATVPRETLDWPMRAALRGIDVPHWVAVHGVDGVAPVPLADLDTPIRSGDRHGHFGPWQWTSRWPARPPTSPSPPSTAETSMTAATARPSWQQEWSKDACTWPA